MISYIVPTIGRESLFKTLDSIECWLGDEIVIVGNGYRVTHKYAAFIRYIDCEPGGDWGHKERNVAMPQARCPFIAGIDDDDCYAPGTRELLQSAIDRLPDGPVLFRMRFPNGITLWDLPELRCGNVGTPMMLVPNQPEKFGEWGSFVGGDCHFLETSKWEIDSFTWRPEIIALLGHNTPG